MVNGTTQCLSFCSIRCRAIDPHHWLYGAYILPTSSSSNTPFCPTLSAPCTFFFPLWKLLSPVLISLSYPSFPLNAPPPLLFKLEKPYQKPLSHTPPLHLNASPPFCLASTPISSPHTSTPTNAGNTVPVHAFTDTHFTLLHIHRNYHNLLPNTLSRRQHLTTSSSSSIPYHPNFTINTPPLSFAFEDLKKVQNTLFALNEIIFYKI